MYVYFIVYRDYELLLPRSEVDEVNQLRTKWLQLLAQADYVRNLLLKEKKTNFEQDLDKQVKVLNKH
jgi:dynein heavy chain